MTVPSISRLSPPLQRSQSQDFINQIIFTDRLFKKRDDESGLRSINQYIIHQMIGKGAYAKVKLVHVINNPEQLFAM
ncbi:MAG: hypothetical protein EZS28_038295, partial [Streblomastix strix]